MIKFVSEVKPIEKPGVEILGKNDLKKIVEIPLLESCQILYDKNIRTVFSSANFKNICDCAYIVIDFDLLSENNKKIGLKLGKICKIHGSNNQNKGIYLSIPIPSKETKIMDIHLSMKALVEQFEKQILNWGYYDANEYLLAYGYPKEEINKDNIQKFADSFNMIYDSERNVLWKSKELFQKSKEL